MTARFLEVQGISIAQEPTKTMRRLISNSKVKLKTDGTKSIAYKVKFEDCGKRCIGQTQESLLPESTKNTFSQENMTLFH